jgi:vacuolar-type H+-ATPase subunit C/Vma6
VSRDGLDSDLDQGGDDERCDGDVDRRRRDPHAEDNRRNAGEREQDQEVAAGNIDDLLGKLESTRYKEVAEELVVNYDKTHSVTVVDEVIEMHKFTYVREMVSTKILSPLLMSWYLVLKELEIRNVRLILKAITDSVPFDKIKDYLVLAS